MRTQFVPLAVLTIVVCPSSSAQWVQTTSPGFDNVAALAVSDTEIFAGTGSGWGGGSGVFRSTNNGATWDTVNSGLTDLDILSLAVHGNLLLAGADCDGLFISSNSGSTWTAAGLAHASIQSLAFSGTDIIAGVGPG